jgi:hypothetical protein
MARQTGSSEELLSQIPIEAIDTTLYGSIKAADPDQG